MALVAVAVPTPLPVDVSTCIDWCVLHSYMMSESQSWCPVDVHILYLHVCTMHIRGHYACACIFFTCRCWGHRCVLYNIY